MTRLIVLMLMLSGCATTAPIQAPPMVIHEPKLADRLPESITKCRSEPSGAAVETNGDARNYILNLRIAGRDCRSKLKAVHTIIYGETPTRK